MRPWRGVFFGRVLDGGLDAIQTQGMNEVVSPALPLVFLIFTIAVCLMGTAVDQYRRVRLGLLFRMFWLARADGRLPGPTAWRLARMFERATRPAEDR